jgi:hypothetical protein
MTRTALFVAVGLAGCSAQPAEPPAAAAPNVALANVALAPGVAVEPAESAAPGGPLPPSDDLPPPVFEYPADLAGKAVVKAVFPPAPPLAPVERFGAEPRPRTPPAKLLDPDFVARVSLALPPVLPPKPPELKPAGAAERVPLDLGRGADAVPSRPTFPVAAGVTERSRDVNLPPPLPALGRPLNDRVGLDDPTAELGNAAVVGPVPMVPVAPAGFLRVVLPDPFELGEQVKPTVPPAAEPGLAPVSVNPQRVK